MDDEECKNDIFKLNESTNVPDCVLDDYVETFGNSMAPIVIDNGNTQCSVSVKICDALTEFCIFSPMDLIF